MMRSITIAPLHLAQNFLPGQMVPLKDLIDLAKSKQQPSKEEVAAWQRRYRQEHKEELAAGKTGVG